MIVCAFLSCLQWFAEVTALVGRIAGDPALVFSLIFTSALCVATSSTVAPKVHEGPALLPLVFGRRRLWVQPSGDRRELIELCNHIKIGNANHNGATRIRRCAAAGISPSPTQADEKSAPGGARFGFALPAYGLTCED